MGRMKNFLRGLRWTWPYRGRLFLSVFCALMAALLWGANLSVIYPVLSLLENGRSWPDQIEEDISRHEKLYDELTEKIARERQRLHEVNAKWPEGPTKEREERALAGTIARYDRRLSTQSRTIYLQKMLKAVVVKLLPPQPFECLLWLFLWVLIGIGIKGVFEFFQESLVGSVANLTLLDLRNRYFRNVIHFDVGHFGDQGTHSLMSHFTNDMELFGVGIKTLYGKVIAEPLRALACIAIASYISWQLTLLFLVLVPVALIVLTRVGRAMKRASRRLLERMSNIYKLLQETFRGIRVVKSCTAEAHERRRFHAASRDYYRRSMQLINLDAITSPVIELLGVAAVSGALLAGAYLVLQQRVELFGIQMCDHPLDIATLLQLYALLAAIADPVRKLSSVYTKIQSGSAAADRIFDGIDLKPKVTQNSNDELVPRLAQSIEFRNVCFAYEAGRPTLANISLEVRAGETVALVGKNGCGKSTLVGLIPRFYDPDYGAVLIDGIDLRKAHLRSLRRQVGLVTQDTVLFDDTVLANIGYGKRRASRAEIEEAAKRAFAHDFIEKMPQGYDTRVGDAGAKLSGGQRQRLALARAILRDPAILILDEFTSQCDPESEQLIHQALRRFMRDRTSFVITHRLNTLEIADRIVVMERGRVEAVGTHADLLRSCEVYQRLHEAHFQRRVA